MRRCVICGVSVLILLSFAGSAASQASEPGPVYSSPRFALKAENLYATTAAEAPLVPGTAAALSALSLGADSVLIDTYFQARVGPLFFFDDFNDLNPGLDVEASIGIEPLPFLAFEVASGYLWAEDEDSGVEDSIWSVPIVANAKVKIPIPLLQPYAGIGAGGYFIHTKQSSGSGSTDESDFVLGWNAFVGLNFKLGPVSLGAQGKFIQTNVFDSATGSARIEAFALLATLGIGF